MGGGHTSNAEHIPLRPGSVRVPSGGTPAGTPDSICALRDHPGGDSLWSQDSRESAVLENGLCRMSGDLGTEGLVDTGMDM